MKTLVDRNESSLIEDGRDFALLMVLPPVGVVGLWLLLSWILGKGIDSQATTFIIIWLSLFGGLVAFPLFYMKLSHHLIQLTDFGLILPGWKSIIPLAAILFITIVTMGARERPIVLILLQYLPVALCEEFWSKGVLFLLATRIFKYRLLQVVIPALAFSFILHIGDPILGNLIARFPMGVICGFIYLKTKTLAWPVVLHLSYDMIIA